MSVKRVLIIEDEIHIQRLLQHVLTKAGLEVRCAASGGEGLDILNKEKIPDLILLDIMMPGTDGLSVLRTIKAQNRFRSVPVVLLTALAQENVVLKGIELGAKDYIRKPFHPTELVERVLKHVA